MADNAVDIDLHHLIPFGHKTRLPKKVIIVHTTENGLNTTSRNIIDYQVRTQTGSYHRLVDSSGKITLANTDDWQTWSTGNRGNDIALHVSVVWRAATRRAEWLQQPQILDGVARVIAYWARTYNIPLVKLTRAELGAGKSGVAGHLEAQVWGNTDHWDPGPGFPYDVVLAKAKAINTGGKPQQVKPAPATGGKGNVVSPNLNDRVHKIEERLDAIMTQLVGPANNSNPAGGRGWPQLGKNAQGQYLTLVDAVSALRHDIANLKGQS